MRGCRFSASMRWLAGQFEQFTIINCMSSQFIPPISAVLWRKMISIRRLRLGLRPIIAKQSTREQNSYVFESEVVRIVFSENSRWDCLRSHSETRSRPTFVSFLFVFGCELFTSGMCSGSEFCVFRGLAMCARYRGEELQKFSTVLKFLPINYHHQGAHHSKTLQLAGVFLSHSRNCIIASQWDGKLSSKGSKFNARSSTMSLLAKCHAKLSPRLVLIEEFLEPQSTVHLRSLFWK